MSQPRSHTGRDTIQHGILQTLHPGARKHQTHPGQRSAGPTQQIFPLNPIQSHQENRKGRARGCYLPSPCRVAGHRRPRRNPWMFQVFPAYPHRWWHSGSSPDESPSDPWPELPNLPAKGSSLEHKQENSFSHPTGLTLDPRDPEAALLFPWEGWMQ